MPHILVLVLSWERNAILIEERHVWKAEACPEYTDRVVVVKGYKELVLNEKALDLGVACQE